MSRDQPQVKLTKNHSNIKKNKHQNNRILNLKVLIGRKCNFKEELSKLIQKNWTKLPSKEINKRNNKNQKNCLTIFFKILNRMELDCSVVLLHCLQLKINYLEIIISISKATLSSLIMDSNLKLNNLLLHSLT